MCPKLQEYAVVSTSLSLHMYMYAIQLYGARHTVYIHTVDVRIADMRRYMTEGG